MNGGGDDRRARRPLTRRQGVDMDHKNPSYRSSFVLDDIRRLQRCPDMGIHTGRRVVLWTRRSTWGDSIPFRTKGSKMIFHWWNRLRLTDRTLLYIAAVISIACIVYLVESVV
jgi:hypothetical protein